MKVGAIPENVLERIALMIGIGPTPMLDTCQAMLCARTIMVASKVGVFEALADKPLSAKEIAEKLSTNERATEKLLNALLTAGYVKYADGRYALEAVSRKWMLPGTEQSLHDNMLHRFLEWQALDQFEEFVRNGESLDVHRWLPADKWAIYQRGMRSVAGITAPEIARRTPVPRNARTLLDIGGSHGYYSVAMCRRHPNLSATVLDLPEAVEHAAELLAAENMGDRVVHRMGDALADDLGESAWDAVFISQLVHHFTEEQNRELMHRVARSLRPGGIVSILELIRTDSPNKNGQTGALLDLFFAVTSESGTWSREEMADWQQDAGLTPRRPIKLLSIPGAGIQAAEKKKSG